MMPHVALALFVKDEFSDIAGWIAWHVALGIKTFFIYDDHSTDGTWEILQAAAKCYDIRLRRIDPQKVPSFQERQRQAYFQSIEEARNECDWIGFLDGDEYLYLKHFDSLPKFLTQFPHADAVAFSWRIYGSSSRVVRPRRHIVDMFRQHSTKEFADNVHIKSFVRPKKMGKKWVDPHIFDIPITSYARPNGTFLTEKSPKQPVQWEDGYVMHFICRSMAHYIQRIQRRLNEDLFDSDSYWAYFNRNELTDNAPMRFLPKMAEKLKPIQNEILKLAIQHLRDLPITPDPKLYPHKQNFEKLEIVKLISLHGTALYYAPNLGHALNCSEETAKENGFQLVYGLINPKTPQIITLALPENAKNTQLHLLFDERSSSEKLYRLIPTGSGYFNLQHPASHRFFCMTPPEPPSGFGNAVADREKAHEWEKIILEPVSATHLHFKMPKLPFEITHKTSAYKILNWLQTAKTQPSSEDFLNVLYRLSPKVQQELSTYVPGLLWGFC
ncbi:glycosyltransferase [Acetobacteraceae bacterium]|nr:glycosyltransferase [Acetobacteraceae bacterium]